MLNDKEKTIVIALKARFDEIDSDTIELEFNDFVQDMKGLPLFEDFDIVDLLEDGGYELMGLGLYTLALRKGRKILIFSQDIGKQVGAFLHAKYPDNTHFPRLIPMAKTHYSPMKEDSRPLSWEMRYKDGKYTDYTKKPIYIYEARQYAPVLYNKTTQTWYRVQMYEMVFREKTFWSDLKENYAVKQRITHTREMESVSLQLDFLLELFRLKIADVMKKKDNKFAMSKVLPSDLNLIDRVVIDPEHKKYKKEVKDRYLVPFKDSLKTYLNVILEIQMENPLKSLFGWDMSLEAEKSDKSWAKNLFLFRNVFTTIGSVILYDLFDRGGGTIPFNSGVDYKKPPQKETRSKVKTTSKEGKLTVYKTSFVTSKDKAGYDLTLKKEKISNLDEFVQSLEKMPTKIAFVYESPIGIFFLMLTYISGRIPSKVKLKRILDSSQLLKATIQGDLKKAGYKIATSQTGFINLNMSKGKATPKLEREYIYVPLEEAKQYLAGFQESLKPYISDDIVKLLSESKKKKTKATAKKRLKNWSVYPIEQDIFDRNVIMVLITENERSKYPTTVDKRIKLGQILDKHEELADNSIVQLVTVVPKNKRSTSWIGHKYDVVDWLSFQAHLQLANDGKEHVLVQNKSAFTLRGGDEEDLNNMIWAKLKEIDKDKDIP
tara:strand:+ start:8156 stop:10135 length:1980 start_codon:yes stop_codon:yes gene_type:complete